MQGITVSTDYTTGCDCFKKEFNLHWLVNKLMSEWWKLEGSVRYDEVRRVKFICFWTIFYSVVRECVNVLLDATPKVCATYVSAINRTSKTSLLIHRSVVHINIFRRTKTSTLAPSFDKLKNRIVPFLLNYKKKVFFHSCRIPFCIFTFKQHTTNTLFL